MRDRLSLVVAIAASLLIHALVIGIGEMATRGADPRPEREKFSIEYGSDEKAGETEESDIPLEEQTEKSISLETPNPLYRPYFTALTRVIDSFWDDPVLEEGDPSEESVVIEFVLGTEGELLAVSVARSSGVRGMDLAAVRAVKMASPFPGIPPEIATRELTIRALFVYD